MSTIAEEIQRLKQAKSSIKASIENKGVTVSDTATLDAYPALIDSIEQTGVGTKMIKASWGLKPKITELPGSLDFSEVSGNITRVFSYDKTLIKVGTLDMPLVTNFSGLFLYCTNIQEIGALNFADGAYAEQLFFGCQSLTSIPDLHGYDFHYDSFFAECRQITTIPDYLSFEGKTWVGYMCNQCTSLTSVPEYDWSTITDTENTFGNCTSLTDLGGFIGLKCNLDLSSCPLTVESMLNVFNDAADVSASPATLTLGSDNLAKLTDEQKAIATGKGWTLA